MKFGPGEVLTVAVAGVSMALVSFGWEQGGRNTNTRKGLHRYNPQGRRDGVGVGLKSRI